MGILARAVVIREPGDVDVLDLAEREVPDPGPGQLRVAVAAAGLNRADILQRRGFYPAPLGCPEDVPGLEYAGVVESVGYGVDAYAPGDRVFGIVGGGAMCTHLLVHAAEAMPVPEGMPLDAAAAVPEAFLTAWDALVTQGEARAGETALVHAVGSGVGTAAVQLCRVLAMASIGTSRASLKLARARALGMSEGVHITSDGHFAEAVLTLTGRRGVDVVLNSVGASYVQEDMACLASRGREVVLGLLGGSTVEVNLGLLLRKRAKLVGTVLRSRSLEEKIDVASGFAAAMLGRFATGELVPVVDAVLPISEVRAAHARMESNSTFGKLVLRW